MGFFGVKTEIFWFFLPKITKNDHFWPRGQKLWVLSSTILCLIIKIRVTSYLFFHSHLRCRSKIKNRTFIIIKFLKFMKKYTFSKKIDFWLWGVYEASRGVKMRQSVSNHSQNSCFSICLGLQIAKYQSLCTNSDVFRYARLI